MAQWRAITLIATALPGLSSTAIGQPPLRRTPPAHAVAVVPRFRPRDLPIARQVTAALAFSRDTTWFTVRAAADVDAMLTPMRDYGGNVIPLPALDSLLTPADLVMLGKHIRAHIVIDVHTIGDSVIVHVSSTRTASRHRLGGWVRSSRGLPRSIVAAFETDSRVSQMLRPK